jgi:hypothetical protein
VQDESQAFAADVYCVSGAGAQMLNTAFGRVSFAHEHAEFEPGVEIGFKSWRLPAIVGEWWHLSGFLLIFC